jgi:MFS family permease
VTASREVPRHSAPSRGWRVAAAASALALVMFCMTLPTPLNALYRDRFGWSELMITVVSAAYVTGALTSLVSFGHVSDKIGHRALVLEGLALSALGVAAFLISDRPAFLIVGHLLAGLSAGISAAAATALLAPGYSIALYTAISMPLIGEGLLAQATAVRPAALTLAAAVAVPATAVALRLARRGPTGQRVPTGVGVRRPVQPVVRPVSSRAVHHHRIGSGPAAKTAKGRARSLQCRPPLPPQR